MTGLRAAAPLVLILGALVAAAPITRTEGGARVIAVDGGGSYTEISPTVLRSMLARKDFLLVDVHIPYAGELAGTDRAIPFNAIDAGLEQLKVRKNAKLVLYCRSGPMSAIAARALVKAGYRDVSILAGGMSAWEDAGQPIIRRGP